MRVVHIVQYLLQCVMQHHQEEVGRLILRLVAFRKAVYEGICEITVVNSKRLKI